VRWPRVGAMKSCYLRFHFDDVHQLGEHLHVASGRSLVFFGSPQPLLQRGDRVLLELIWVTGSEQQAVLRGIVRNRVEGRGVWLEFPDEKLARRAAAQGTLAGRRQHRLPVDLMVEVKPRHGPALVGRLLDVSMEGARVVGIQRLNEGAEIELQELVPVRPALGRARVVRPGAEAAVRFLRRDASSRVAVSKLFESARQAWAQVNELTHPRSCCRGGGPDEPPVPQVRALL
jgi:hypothetical protein